MKFRIILEIALLFAAIAVIFLQIKNSESKVQPKLITDTLLIESKRENINLSKIKPRLIYKRDTLIETMPFLVTFDTVIKKDSIAINYQYPENELNLILTSEKDTLKHIINAEIKDEKFEIIHYLPSFLLGMVLGLLTLFFQ